MLDGLDARLQRLDRVAGSTGTRSTGDHRPGVDALVDVVHGRGGLGHAGGERVLDRVRCRELRQQRRVGVDDRPGKAVEERGRSRCM